MINAKLTQKKLRIVYAILIVKSFFETAEKKVSLYTLPKIVHIFLISKLNIMIFPTTLLESTIKEILDLERTLQAAQLPLARDGGAPSERKRVLVFGNLEIKRNSRTGPAL
jgi:hypothetical protein